MAPTQESSKQFNIKAVVFDLDGLMFNTENVFQISGNELLGRRGKVMSVELRNQMMGRRADEAFAIMIETLELTESISELREESEAIFFSLLDEHLAPMPGLLQLLAHIEECELPKAVATSSTRPYLEDILSRFELKNRFQFLLSAEDVQQGKPHPEVYLKAAAQLEIAPAEMLVLEDSEAGTKAAASAGAFVVSIPHRHTAGHDYSPSNYIAESLVDPFVLNLLTAQEL